MSGWLYQPLPLAQGDAAAPPEHPRRPVQFVNGQGAAHVGNLVGFAGSALFWASAAALFVASPQPQLQAAELTFGLHAAAIAQSNQSAQFFKSPHAVFVQVAGGPPNRPEYFVAPQEELDRPSFFNRPYPAPVVVGIPPRNPIAVGSQEAQEQAQPAFTGQTPRPAPAFKPWTVPPQESPEQTAPFLFGQQPLPSPAGKPIWTAGELQQGSQAATIWNAAADLFIAAAQFNVPPRPFKVTPGQESPEQVQPLVFGQQPLPSPPSQPFLTARDEDQPSESAQFWGSDATRFIAATQFDVRPRAFSAGPQESPEQTQPVVFGQEPASAVADEVTVRQFSAGPEESTEQIQPVIFGQAPASALADEITIRQFSAGPQESEEQSQPGFDRAFFAPVPIRTITAGPQDGLEQAQPWFGRQYRPAVDQPILRPVQAAPEETQEQVQPAFNRTYFVPLLAPALGPALFAAPQEDQEQAGPQFYRQLISDVALTSPAFRQFFAQDQYNVEQPQPVIVNLPLPESQVVPPEPPATGGGGDRGVILFREPRPEPRRIPRPAKFAVSFFQDGQRFTARVDSESFLAFNGVSQAGFDFSARVDASSTVSYRSDQAQKFAAAVSVSGQVRSFAPVKATFTATRLRVVFAQSTNQMHCKIEIES